MTSSDTRAESQRAYLMALDDITTEVLAQSRDAFQRRAAEHRRAADPRSSGGEVPVRRGEEGADVDSAAADRQDALLRALAVVESGCKSAARALVELYRALLSAKRGRPPATLIETKELLRAAADAIALWTRNFSRISPSLPYEAAEALRRVQFEQEHSLSVFQEDVEALQQKFDQAGEGV